jgi:hypothetical protein
MLMNDQPPKPRRGCFFYGCISGLVLLLILAIGGLLAVHYAKKKVTALIAEYTDSQPATLPTAQISAADLDQLKQRFAAFDQAVRAGQPVPPLTLTANEINALVASGKDQQWLKGKVYVSFDGDRLKGEMSIPLNDIGWKMFRNRYLNGSGTFKLALQKGVLFVAPQTIVVKGKPVPEMYMQGLRNANFAAALTNQPDAMAVVQHLKDIEVKDGKLIVTPKETTEAAAPKAERE